MGLVGGQNSPLCRVLSEGGGGVGRKETPSMLCFERGRWLDDCRLAFRAREGWGWLEGKAPPLCRVSSEGVGRKETPSVSRFERGRWLDGLTFQARDGAGWRV